MLAFKQRGIAVFRIILSAIIFCAVISLSAAESDRLDISTSNSGVEISFSPSNIENFSTQNISTSFGDFTLLSLPDAQWTTTPGEPLLPVYVFVLGLPANGDVKFDYDIVWGETHRLDYPIMPADSAFWENGEIENVPIAPSSRIYRAKGNYPQDPVRFEDSGFLRSQRLGRIIITPVKYEPQNGYLNFAKEVKIHISFDASGKFVDEGDFEKVFKNMLINYQQAKNMRRQRTIVNIPDNPFAPSDVWYRSAVHSGGVFAITSQWLEDAGLDPNNVNPAEIRVFTYGVGILSLEIDDMPTLEEISLISIGNGDETFDNSDTLLVYIPDPEPWTASAGDPIWYQSPYCDSTSVWIAIGGDFSEPAKRSAEISVVGAAEERNFGWTFSHIGEDLFFDEEDKIWYWQRIESQTALFVSDPRISTERFPNGFIRANPSSNCIAIDCNSASYSCSEAWTNGVNSFVPGSNIITFQYSDTVFFRYAEMRYLIELMPQDGILHFLTDTLSPVPSNENPVRFDLSDFDEPMVIDVTNYPDIRWLATGEIGENFYFDDTYPQREYFVFESGSSGTITQLPSPQVLNDFSLWDEPQTQTDYIILAPKSLDPSNLADFQESNGLDVKIYNIEDIMTQFGFGRYDPTAIRNFLCYIYNRADEPKPQYAVFIGDGHYDYKHVITDSKIYFPPAMLASHFTDAFFSTFEDSGVTLEMMSGRLPARTQTELEDIIAKTIDYSNCAPFGKWRINTILTADDEYRDDGRVDNLSYTCNNSDIAVNYLPPQAFFDPVYLVDYPRTSTLRKPEATDALMNYMRSSGVWVNWIGHGNYHLWAHEHLLNFPGDMTRWQCGKKLPLMSSFSCYVGEFFRIGGKECISELLLREPDNGAIAAISATSGSSPTSNQNMNRRLAQNIFADEPMPIAGAMISARNGLYPSHDSQYILFGDPALTLAYPYRNISLDVQPDTITPGIWLQVSGTADDTVDGTAMLFLQGPLIYKHYDSPIIDASCDYAHPGKILFAGAASVSNGEFALPIFVPKILSDTTGYKIIAYIYSDENCYNASSAITDIPANPSVANDIIDTTGPEIDITFDAEDFNDGETVCSQDGSLPVQIALSDSHGIDMGTTPGHGITLQLDDEFNRVDVSQNLTYVLDNPTQAVVKYTFEDVAYGGHTVCVQAWDNLGNPSQKCIDLELKQCSSDICNVLPYPNPFQNDGVDITFSLAGSGTEADITLTIFSIAGRKIYSTSKTTNKEFDWLHWNGRASNGEFVARGAYIYVLQAKLHSSNGKTETKTVRGKIVKK